MENLEVRYRHPLLVNRDSEDDYDSTPCEDIEDAKTLAELRMIQLSWAIRQKKQWQEKLGRPDVVERWKEEAATAQELLPSHQKLSANMISYVFTELEAYARLSEAKTGIQHACNDATFCSYSLIPDDVTQVLREGIAELENVPEDRKDWHPGSNDQVLDLVHPSLYCLAYGQSLVRDDNGELSWAQPYRDDEDDNWFSDKYAWLPSDFFIDASGGASLTSPYINNLPKGNTKLYSIIPSILSSFIPLFERVLGAIDATHRPGARRGTSTEASDAQEEDTPLPGRIIHDGDSDLPCIWPDDEPPEEYSTAYANDFVGFPGDTRQERRLAWAASFPGVRLPDSPPAYQGALERDFRVADLRGRTLQCIVKLANIQLTPEKPSYPGGSWHVEGMLNERIVATGIYYYDAENISESHLQFRTSIPGVTYHAQNDDMCTHIVYGLTYDSELVQERGQISTCAGLSLAFPNIHQHRVSPFHLVDPTKPGHRKILAFFLVDPTIRIPSASNVAPQQGSWMADFMHDNSEATGVAGTYFARLPVEVRDEIVGLAFMSEAEAREIREDLMQERGHYVDMYNEEVMRFPYNLCEH
ncbi:hypothetical protein EIP91_010971 [Steccherinum ochraceum]|uniref:Uncharacterized protein n=1 Tax=Steccherinum ochraceum TaxID=92696 RepID=A0A4R0RMR9_9APHY|nr:hypothetical protein EIP91_010971 [Steccherinum ochraceum]